MEAIITALTVKGAVNLRIYSDRLEADEPLKVQKVGPSSYTVEGEGGASMIIGNSSFNFSGMAGALASVGGRATVRGLCVTGNSISNEYFTLTLEGETCRITRRHAGARVIIDGVESAAATTNAEETTAEAQARKEKCKFRAMVKLQRLDLAGSADVELQPGAVEPERFGINVMGSGSVKTLEGQTTGVGCLEAVVSGSGDIILGGNLYAIKSILARVMGSGDVSVYCNRLAEKSREVLGSGSAKIRVLE